MVVKHFFHILDFSFAHDVMRSQVKPEGTEGSGMNRFREGDGSLKYDIFHALLPTTMAKNHTLFLTKLIQNPCPTLNNRIVWGGTYSI